MKKKIGFVSMDSVLAQWLLEKLIQEPPESECAEDLLSGIHDMLSGEATSLLLSTSKEAESSLPPSDEIRIGELEIYPKSRRVRMQGAEVSLTPKEFGNPLFSCTKQRRGFLQRSKSIKRFGLKIIFWMIAISWRSSESCERKSNPIRMSRNIF